MTYKQEQIMPLHQQFARYFDIGAAVSSKMMETQAELLKRHYNSLTCENEMVL